MDKEKYSFLYSKEIYDPTNKDLIKYQIKQIEKVNKFNRTHATIIGLSKRNNLLKKMMGSVGTNCYIEPPVHANFGLENVHFGSNVYANFNLTCVDDGEIFIDDNTMIGPNVVIATAVHPVSPDLRLKGLQYNLPVHIGRNVWIGSGAMIMPGVNIGDNSIIGAGSVVTKDIPSNVIAFGNPCKVKRPITEDDYLTYNHGIKIPQAILDKYGSSNK